MESSIKKEEKDTLFWSPFCDRHYGIEKLSEGSHGSNLVVQDNNSNHDSLPASKPRSERSKSKPKTDKSINSKSDQNDDKKTTPI